MKLLCPILTLVVCCSARGVEFNGRNFTVADGYTMSEAAPPSLVERPIEACFDDKGRLFVTESSGSNEKVEEQLKKKPHRLLRIEDTNGDGMFDKRMVFADNLMFPEGVLWHQGIVYVSAPPQIWKFTDANDDGVAEKREVWFDGKTLTGCANDLHGPYAGPDGLLYWCKGAFAEQSHDLPGKPGWKTRASHVFRMKPDGTEFDCVFTAGMDNPVGLEWLPEGDLIVSGTFLVNPGDGKRDGLIHAVRGGVWGKDHDVLDGHIRTGPLMPAMTHMGPAAPCGMCRYGRDLLVCQFNLRKVSRHVLEPDGSTWKTIDSDFLTCDHPDFHPTDVLQAPDGSVLVVDTGGWYKLCCPTSQIARPEVPGGIYRLRKTGGEVSTACPEPRWKLEKPDDLMSLAQQLKAPNLHIRRMAASAMGKLMAKEDDSFVKDGHATGLVEAALAPDADRFMEHAILFGLYESGDAQALYRLSGGAGSCPVPHQRMLLYFYSQVQDRSPMLGSDKEMCKLIASPDASVREAAIFAMQHSELFRNVTAHRLESFLEKGTDPEVVRPAVEAVAEDNDFRLKLGNFLVSAKPGPMQHMLLEVMTRAAARHKFAPEWAEALVAILEATDAAGAPLAAKVFAAKPSKMGDAVREKLAGMARDKNRPATVRLPLMLALSPITPSDEEFSLLMAALNPSVAPDSVTASLAPTAAAVIAKASLSNEHLSVLAEVFPQIGLLHRPQLLRAFSKATDEALGLALVGQLEKSGSLAGLSADVLRECLGKFPDKVQQRLAAARATLTPGLDQQRARLDELEKTLPEGEIRRGAVVFQHAKASCVLCHQAGYLGTPLGPDLSKIGGIRTRRDLLEAIAFPSASFVRSYEPVEVKKKDGSLAYGMIRHQNAQAVTLITGAVTPDVTVATSDIAALNPGAASLMPQGVDQILTPQELADLVAFLMSMK